LNPKIVIGDRRKPTQTTALEEADPALVSRQLKITNSIQSQGLDTPANGNYIRMFGSCWLLFLYRPLMPENSYFAHYIPLLFQVIVAIALAAVMVTLSHLLGKHKWSRAKNTAYECGIEPTGDAQQRFSVKFYLVGMLFILFDVEVVFLYPWAIIARELKMFGFWEMMIYIGLVLVGFFYIWKKGILDWNSSERTIK
jgi:NADH-quinone oxidoreductase subunit A